MKTCEKCGLINDDNAVFCTSCGEPLPVDTDAAKEAAELDETAVEEVIEEVVTEDPAVNMDDEVIEPVPVIVPATTQVSAAQTDAAPTPKKGEHTVKGRAFGIIGFILNLDALLCCLIPGTNFGALIYSIIGLIFCHISKNNTNFKLTKVAKIFGILALIFSIVTILVYCLLSYLAFEALAHDPQVQDFIGRLFTDLLN